MVSAPTGGTPHSSAASSFSHRVMSLGEQVLRDALYALEGIGMEVVVGGRERVGEGWGWGGVECG